MPNETAANLMFFLVALGAIIVWLQDITPLNEFWHVILFYTLLLWGIYHYRHKLEWQARFIGFYKTKIGLKLMDKWAPPTRFEIIGKVLCNLAIPFLNISLWGLLILLMVGLMNQVSVMVLLVMLVLSSGIYTIGLLFRPIKTFGTHAIYTGFIGMLVMFIVIIKAIFDFVFSPEVAPAVSIVIPGIPVPGADVTIPLIYGWLGLFLVIVVHEFSHGVVARAHKIPVHSSGLFFMGPFAGAFVEPDEKKMKKLDDKTNLAVFAAGPFSNMVLFGLLTLFVSLLAFGAQSLTADQGLVFKSVEPGFPADSAGIVSGKVYRSLNGEPMGTDYRCAERSSECYPYDFLVAMNNVSAGDTIVLEDISGQEYVLEAAPHPQNESRGYIGVFPGVLLKSTVLEIPYKFLMELTVFLYWASILSFGIGLANLLPIIITDGGRMFQIATRRLFKEKTGTLIYQKLGHALFFLIIILVIGGMIRYWILPHI